MNYEGDYIMPGASRDGDACAGHPSFAPTTITSGSQNVNVNGIGAVNLGKVTTIHNLGNDVHNSTISSGSSNVNINGKAATRILDDTSCGQIVMTGSSNVFFGG